MKRNEKKARKERKERNERKARKERNEVSSMNLSTITMVHIPILVRYCIVLSFYLYSFSLNKSSLLSSLPRTC